MTDLVYAAAYPLYRDRGWSVIKLRAGIKYPPPAGFTGRDGIDPSGADMHAWAEEEPGGNLAIRLPVEVIGIDVDAYGGKTGAQTLAEAEKRWGKLPYSPRSTSRDDGISGIRLYRIPPGVELVGVIEFPELGIGDIEICQRHHRYVMGWPSIHPSGRRYQWLGIDDGPLGEPPAPDDIPDLPAGWVEALTKPVHNHADLGGNGAYDVRRALTEGEMSRRVAWKLGEAVAACDGANRHDHTRDNALGLLRYGKQGDSGVRPALKALQKAFVAAVGPDRPGGTAQAADEFRDFVNSGRVAKLLAQPDHDDWTHNLSEPPPDDHHAGEWTSQPPTDDEGASNDAPRKETFRTQLLSVTDLANLPPVQPLVDGLLYRNTLAQLSGPPGSYKSFISVDLSCALASGQTSWEGHHIANREKVVYVAAEGASGLLARILAWCEHHNVDPDQLEGWLFILPLPIQLGAIVQVDQAVEMAKDIGAGLLVLDTRARCTLGLEENSATEQGEAVHAADRIRGAADCTVWGIHHTGRNGSTPRGSTAWDGAVWTDLRLTAEDGTVEIKVEKHKDAPSGKTFNYRMIPHTVSDTLMRDTPEESRKSLVVFSFGDENSDKILTGVRKTVEKIAENSCGLEGLSRARLVDMAVTAGLSQASAYRAVNALVEAGSLHNIGTLKQRRYIYMGRKLGDDDNTQI